MADQQLLSRRQILALFGAGTGMAIIGAQGQQTQDVDGNVLGGADNMPAPYKVGESTYKGPLSVRSEVPQEDGITFIQTDAGSNNDQFSLHHYNGGWGQQGLNTKSLDTEQLNNAKYPDPADNVAGIRNAIDQDGVTVILREGAYEVEDGSFDPPRIPIAHNDVTVIMEAGAEIFVPDGITEADKGIRLFHVGGDDNTPAWNGTNAYDGFTLIGNGGVINGNYQNQGNISDTYDGHNIQIQGSEFVVRGVRSINATGDGIEPIARGSISDTQDYIVANNVFRSCFEHNIHLHGGRNGEIAGNVCRGEVNNSAINFFTQKVNNERLNVHHNIFSESQKNGAAISAGPNGQLVIDLQFENNILARNSGDGIFVDSPHTRGLSIKDNLLAENGSNGIAVNGANHIDIARNTAVRNESHGIFCSGNSDTRHLSIEDNTVRNNNQGSSGATGIRLVGNGNAYEHLRLHRNEITSDTSFTGVNYEHGYGLYFAEPDATTTYTNVTVKDTEISNTINAKLFNGWPDGVIDFRANPGYQTRDQGTVTVTAGSTTATATYSTDAPIGKKDVIISPVGNWVGSAATQWELRNVGNGDFDLLVDSDPTQDVLFSWVVSAN